MAMPAFEITKYEARTLGSTPPDFPFGHLMTLSLQRAAPLPALPQR